MDNKNLHLKVTSVGVGTTFVWGHGLLSSMAQEVRAPWHIYWDQLAEKVNVVRYDARGHGTSQGGVTASEYVWSALARDMLAIARQQTARSQSFILGGQSMGAATALWSALQAPQRIKALVLMTPPTLWEARAAQSGNYEQMADLVEAGGVSMLVDYLERKSSPPRWQLDAYPDMLTDHYSALHTFDRQTLVSILRGAAMSNLPSRERLTVLQMPTFVLCWTGDPVHPLQSGEAIAELLPNAHLSVATNASEIASWTAQLDTFIGNVGI